MALLGAGGSYDLIILGAGCTGLSLCHYLRESTYDGRILVLDRKSTFEDDRTWSFWDVEPTPFNHLATATWNAWTVSTDEKTQLRKSSAHPYLSLRAIDFYEDCLRRCEADAKLDIVLGEKVVHCAEVDGGVRVRTDTAEYTAGHVFDARGLHAGSREFTALRESSVWVPQHFVGQRIKASRAVFDDSVCALMDFRVSQDRGVHFMYVLPGSPRESLVENVYFSFAKVDADTHREEIRDFLRNTYDLGEEDYEVEHEENGFIPMSDHRFAGSNGSRIEAVGTLAGATRPSTGYAFLRIQRECRAVAASFALGTTQRQGLGDKRRRILDVIFLRFMTEQPRALPALYLRMFERVPHDSLIRFMTECSSVGDEIRLILALPKRPFIRIVLRMAAQRMVPSRTALTTGRKTA